MKKLSLAIILLLSTTYLLAQTKVFKEVNSEISSQLRVITQDGALVGYLAFTELERADEDSFNYKITIMDENLNDIGVLNFREVKLALQGVSFEQDVLCLAYLKSNVLGYELKKKEFRAVADSAYLSIFTQFVSLQGKIIGTHAVKVDVKLSELYHSSNNRTAIGASGLNHSLQLRNLSGKGFVGFYGDNSHTRLLVFNTAGELTWQKEIMEKAWDFSLMASNHEIYLLFKKKEKMIEGGYGLLGYNTDDSTAYPVYLLKDKRGNSLKVLSFENDPATGKPYLAGEIIDARRGNKFTTVKELTKGTYSGVFTINLNGHQKGDIKEVFSYWNDGSSPIISRKGFFTATGTYARLSPSFKDFQGNTYFAGSSFIRRTRWGAIGASVVTAPLILPPVMILGMTGINKYKVTDAMLLKQNAKGVLSVENTIASKHSIFISGRAPFSMYDNKGFYTVVSSDAKSTYLIINDVKNILVYHVDQKKVIRTIPRKDGNIRTGIFPAKDGHVMVSEYDKKERSTRYSIESL